MTTDDVGTHHGASANNAAYSAENESTLCQPPAITDAPRCVPTSGQKDGQLPSRKSPRANFHDYNGGNYFVTICTKEKRHYFGEIIDGRMVLSLIGRFANEGLASIHTHHAYVEVPLYVVMPNHIHAIVCIHRPIGQSGDLPTGRTALSVVVGGYKQSVTRFARQNGVRFAWQARYHDHIIRGTEDGNKIACYIESNVSRWDADSLNVHAAFSPH